MKKIKIAALAWIICLVIVYAIAAFVSLKINVFQWGEIGRLLLCLLPTVASLITIVIENPYE